MPKLIAQGAEAKIFLDKNIIKHRVKKDYRIKEIDNRLRKSRTKREAKVIKKLEKFNFTPKLIENDEKEKLIIEYIDGPKIRDILKKTNCKKLCTELGKKIKILHNNEIIHGDLTTSNFILNKNNNKIYFIDFGLSFFSPKVEHKAVDLHLLRQALESKHYKIWERCFQEVLKGYNDKEVEKRLEKVEKRGRYKSKN